MAESEHFPPKGDPSDLNELAALAESADPSGFMVLDVRFGVASAVLNSEWLAERERRIRADAWDEGRKAGDPYQRRGNPDEAQNPYRTREEESNRGLRVLREIFSDDQKEKP